MTSYEPEKLPKRKLSKLDVEMKFANLFLKDPDIKKLKDSGLVSESGRSTYKLIDSEDYLRSKHVLVVIGGEKQKILHNFNPFIVVDENTILNYIDEIKAKKRWNNEENTINDEIEGIEMKDMSHVKYGGKKSRKPKSKKTRKSKSRKTRKSKSRKSKSRKTK